MFGRGLFDDAEPPVTETTQEGPPESLAPAAVARPKRRRGAASRSAAPRHAHVRGAPVRAVTPAGHPRDISWAATLMAAARRRSTGPGSDLSAAPSLRPTLEDVRVWDRRRRTGRVCVVLVDLSGSMGAAMGSLAHLVVLERLRTAYERREEVALIGFRERRAAMILAPTTQAERVAAAMRDLPTGGTTPLAAGLEAAHVELVRIAQRDPSRERSLIVISDGRANVGSRPGREPVLAEVERASRAVRALMPAVDTLFLDTTPPGKHDEDARRLAEWLGARRTRTELNLPRRGAG